MYSLKLASLATAPLLWLLASASLSAETLPLPTPDTQWVGEVRIVEVGEEDTLMDIAREQGVGYEEIRRANPHLDIWLPGVGNAVTIPSSFLLPDAPRDGIVLNRGEMRLYYFHTAPETGAPQVTTYPVGIGRADRQTPTGQSRITMKMHNPAWYPTENVRADYASRGKELPRTIPPGPDNPLGEYAMMLDIPGYLIHGTNRPDGIGMRVSQGCVRLYPENIESLVEQVPLQTPVVIVDQPIKVALVGGSLMAEVHPSVYGGEEETAFDRERKLIRRISDVLTERRDELKGKVDWEWVTEVAKRADGMPYVISKKSPSPPE